MDTLDDYLTTRPATALRPLQGLTILLVEDSRFASEAMRLLCQRSGARIRRADSLMAARRHLRVYRPGAVIADLGLPDGSGAELIAELSAANPRIEVILGTSGDPDVEDLALTAGADGFIAKPIESIAAFQSAILSHLSRDRQPPGPRLVSNERILPDRIAYHDDLAHVADVLTGDEGHDLLPYLTQFLSGVARSAGDRPMQDAVSAIIATRNAGLPLRPPIAELAALVQTRLGHAGVI